MKWLICFVCLCFGKGMVEKMVVELMVVSKGEGVVVKCKEDMYCMVEFNCVFVYF